MGLFVNGLLLNPLVNHHIFSKTDMAILSSSPAFSHDPEVLLRVFGQHSSTGGDTPHGQAPELSGFCDVGVS